jgi:hypothetical protein
VTEGREERAAIREELRKGTALLAYRWIWFVPSCRSGRSWTNGQFPQVDGLSGGGMSARIQHRFPGPRCFGVRALTCQRLRAPGLRVRLTR